MKTKILIKKQVRELVRGLEIVKPALTRREHIKHSNAFIFMADSVQTYNGDICIIHPIPNLGFNGAVNGKLFYQFLKDLKGKDLIFSSTEKSVTITGKGIKAEFDLEAALVWFPNTQIPEIMINERMSLPEENFIDDLYDSSIGRWSPVPYNFVNGLKFLIPNCSKDCSQYKLMCIHIAKDGQMEATNGFDIARYKIRKLGINSFLLPAQSAVQVAKINPTEMIDLGGWISFRSSEGVIISCEVNQLDKYPDTKPYLHKDKLTSSGANWEFYQYERKSA